MLGTVDKTTHAQRRRSETQEAIRLKLRGMQFIRRLAEIAKKCEEAEPAKIPALRLKADIYLRLLSKCVPDQRAVEATHLGPDGGPILVSSTDAEL